jgi:hypothetical protein
MLGKNTCQFQCVWNMLWSETTVLHVGNGQGRGKCSRFHVLKNTIYEKKPNILEKKIGTFLSTYGFLA